MRYSPAMLAAVLGVALSVQAGAQSDRDSRYLAFQVFTNFTTDPQALQALNNGMKDPLVPGAAALRDYVLDIKNRIGTTGGSRTSLAVILGPLSFEQTDRQISEYIENAFTLAIETDLAIGFHIDDSIFW